MATFEEYKMFAESTEFLTKRREAAIQVYLTVNTAIFAVFGFLAKDVALKGWPMAPIIFLPLVIVGVSACWAWARTIMRYRALIGWRYQQLIEMEKTPGLATGYQLFTRERNAFFSPEPEQRKLSFSELEGWLPRLFIGLYVIVALSLIAVLAV